MTTQIRNTFAVLKFDTYREMLDAFNACIRGSNFRSVSRSHGAEEIVTEGGSIIRFRVRNKMETP